MGPLLRRKLLFLALILMSYGCLHITTSKLPSTLVNAHAKLLATDTGVDLNFLRCCLGSFLLILQFVLNLSSNMVTSYCQNNEIA